MIRSIIEVKPDVMCVTQLEPTIYGVWFQDHYPYLVQLLDHHLRAPITDEEGTSTDLRLKVSLQRLFQRGSKGRAKRLFNPNKDKTEFYLKGKQVYLNFSIREHLEIRSQGGGKVRGEGIEAIIGFGDRRDPVHLALADQYMKNSARR